MTLTLPHWTIYHRGALGTAWTDISSKVTYKGLEWTDRLSDKVSFTVPVVFAPGDTILDIEPGDFIAICKDSTKFEIADSILCGIVDNPNKEIAGLDYVNFSSAPYEVMYSLECTGWDYSRANITSYEYSQQSISSIIAAILEADSQELLGGVINGVTISKYSLKCPSFTVDSFKAIEKTAYEAIDQLCNENKLYYKLIWYSSPNTTTGLNLAAQVLIFDDTGLQPKHPFWNDTGITDNALKTGLTTNPNYDPVNNLNVAQYVPTIKKPKTREDQSNIRNYLVFDGHYSEAGAFDNDLADLERYETTAQGVNNDTYYLPHPAFDIYSGGFLVSGYVTAETVPSTTQFSINSGLSGSVVIGDKIVINKGTDIRTVSGVSGNLITLSTALPSAPVTNDLFEVIQQDWITIYDENENTAVYSSRGFAKDLKLDQQAKIRWLADRSIPPPGTILVFYYWPAKPYKRVVKLSESIDKYGLKRADIKSDTILTKTQIDSLLSSFENQTPNKTLELSSYLSVLAGDMIPINITGFCYDKLMVNSVSGKYGGIKKYELINSYEISLSNNYKEDFNDLLGRLTTKANYKNSGSSNFLERISDKITVNINLNSAFMKQKIFYTRIQNGNTELFKADLDFTNQVQITNNNYQGFYGIYGLYNNYLAYGMDPLINGYYGNWTPRLLNLTTGNEVNFNTDWELTRVGADFDTICYKDWNDGEIYKYVISTATATKISNLAGATYGTFHNPFLQGDYIYYIDTDLVGSEIRKIHKSTLVDSLVYSAPAVDIIWARPNYAGTHLAFSTNASSDIFTITSAGGSLTNQTNFISGEWANYPTWNLTDDKIYFLYSPDGISELEIWRTDFAGATTEKVSNGLGSNDIAFITFDIHYAE